MSKCTSGMSLEPKTCRVYQCYTKQASQVWKLRPSEQVGFLALGVGGGSFTATGKNKVEWSHGEMLLEAVGRDVFLEPFDGPLRSKGLQRGPGGEKSMT